MIFVTRAERLSAQRLSDLQKCLGERGLKNTAVFGRLTFRDRTGEIFPPDGLKGQRVLALSGLGDPASFENALTQVGALVVGERHGDHHYFTAQEGAAALARARREGRRLVVTEKDLERLPEAFPALVARLDWQMKEEDAWASVIESVFS